MWMHDDYLDRLEGADSNVRFRVTTCEEFLRGAVSGISFENLFIGQGAPPGAPGAPFGGLWYFTDDYRITVGDFQTPAPKYQIMRAGQLEGCAIAVSGWEEGGATESSEMQVEWMGPFQPVKAMVARGGNCTQLYEVTKAFLLPKLRLI